MNGFFFHLDRAFFEGTFEISFADFHKLAESTTDFLLNSKSFEKRRQITLSG